MPQTIPEYRIAAAYIRVSTDDQVELSPDSQLVEIRKWAAQNGYIVPDEFVFVDEAKTGRKVTGRDQFRRMIGAAKTKPKPFDAILLWKFSRFARNRDDAVFYKSVLRKQLHIDVISIKEPVAEGKLGILIEAMIEAMDEYYSINLAEDVKRGMEEKHRRGELQSNPAFGYRVQDNILVPKEPEASYVKEIFRRFNSGEGCFPISRWLNDLGVRTHRGNPFENRTVEYIIRNPVYIGKLRWNPTGRSRRDYSNPGVVLVNGKHEPLVDEETWNAAQLRIAEIKAVWKYHGRPAASCKDWVSGLVRCASCGGSMVFAKPHYWKCGNYVRARCKTTQHISADLLKDAIIRRLQEDLLPASPLSFEIVRSGNAADASAALRAQRDSLLRRLDRLRDAYLSGADTVEEYKAAKEATYAAIQETEQQIQAEAKKDTLSASPDAVRSAIRATLETLTSPDATMEQQYDAAHSIIDCATWSKAENLLQIHYRIVV